MANLYLRRNCGWLLLLAFGLITAGVMTHAAWVTTIDASLATVASAASSPANTTIFKIVGAVSSPAAVLALTTGLCLWLWLQHRRRLAVAAGSLQLVGAALAELIKQLVARPRPTHQLVADHGFSFPSGHTFCTTIFVLTVCWLGLPLLHNQEAQLVATILAWLWVALVAAGRVYLRDHFATDVFASMTLATGYWLVVTSYFAPRLTTPLRKESGSCPPKN